MAKAFGEVQIVITRLSEDQEEQECGVSQSHEVDLPGTKFGSQWLIEPPYKSSLLHRQQSWHLRLSRRRRHFIGLREELAEDVDRGKDDDWRKVGIVASLIEQFPSFLNLHRRQGDEVVGPAHGCGIALGGQGSEAGVRHSSSKVVEGSCANRVTGERAMSLKAARNNEVQRCGRKRIGNKYEQTGPLIWGPPSVRPAAWAIFGWCRYPGLKLKKGPEVSGIAKLWARITRISAGV